MSYQTDINAWLQKDGGVLARVESLDEAGSLLAFAPDYPVRDILIDDGKIAFLQLGSGRPHVFKFTDSEKLLDEWQFTLPLFRISISPIWLEAQRQNLRSAPQATAEAVEQMKEVFDAVQR